MPHPPFNLEPTLGKVLEQYHPASVATVVATSCLAVVLHLDENVHKKHLETSPLVSYAAQHWVEHAKYGDVASHVQSLWKSYLTQRNDTFQIT